MRPGRLLDALLCRCWRGDVTLATAAKLVGIRKADFCELVHGRLMEELLCCYYLMHFNYAFPECDPRTRKREPMETWNRKRREYTDAELMEPPEPKNDPSH